MSKLADRNISNYKEDLNHAKKDYNKEEYPLILDQEDMVNHYSNYQKLSPEQEDIAQWLGKLKFRKQYVGGVSEYDVWKKIIELNAMYEEALKAENIRCDTLIDHYTKTKNNKEVKEEREKIKHE